MQADIRTEGRGELSQKSAGFHRSLPPSLPAAALAPRWMPGLFPEKFSK